MVEAASVVELKGCVVVAVVVVVVFFLFLLNRSKAGIRMSGNLAMGLRNGGRLLILGFDVVDESAVTKFFVPKCNFFQDSCFHVSAILKMQFKQNL